MLLLVHPLPGGRGHAARADRPDDGPILAAGLHELGEVTPTTIAKAYRLLRRILNVAVEAGYLPRNPAVIKGTGLERAAEMRHVSIPQLHALAEAVPGRYRALVLVAGYGGLRRGDLVGLRRPRAAGGGPPSGRGGCPG